MTHLTVAVKCFELLGHHIAYQNMLRLHSSCITINWPLTNKLDRQKKQRKQN